MPPKKRTLSDVIASTCDGYQLRDASQRRPKVIHSPELPPAKKGGGKGKGKAAAASKTKTTTLPSGPDAPPRQPTTPPSGSDAPPPQTTTLNPPPAAQTLPTPDPPRTRTSKVRDILPTPTSTLNPLQKNPKTTKPPPQTNPVPKSTSKTIQLTLRRSPRNSKTLRAEKPHAKPPKAPVFISETEARQQLEATDKGNCSKAKYPARRVIGSSSQSNTSSGTVSAQQNQSLGVAGNVQRAGKEVAGKEMGAVNMEDESVERHEAADEEDYVEEADEWIAGVENDLEARTTGNQEEADNQSEEELEDPEEEDPEQEDPEEEDHEQEDPGEEDPVAAGGDENANPPVVLSIRCKA